MWRRAELRVALDGEAERRVPDDGRGALALEPPGSSGCSEGIPPSVGRWGEGQEFLLWIQQAWG